MVGDARRDPRAGGALPRYRSLVLQPLRYGPLTLGVMEIAHHRPGAYGPNEVRLIERFGRQVALALQLDSLVRPMTQSAAEMEGELRALGYRKLSARPRHHAQDVEAVEAFKKGALPPRWIRSERPSRAALP